MGLFFGRRKDSSKPGRSREAARARESELRELERRAEEAEPGFDAHFHNRAGDLCVQAGDTPRALRYYGRAVDAYLHGDRYDAAAAVCRKLLRLSPSIVRARCTLAWLAIGKGLASDARREIAAYVESARQADQEDLAARHLSMMAGTSEDAELVHFIGEQLLSLGDDEAADRCFGEAYRLRTTDRAAAAAERDERWERVLRAALMAPNDLNGGGS